MDEVLGGMKPKQILHTVTVMGADEAFLKTAEPWVKDEFKKKI